MNQKNLSVKWSVGLPEGESPTRRVSENGSEKMLIAGYASTWELDRHFELFARSAWDGVPKDGAGVRFLHGHNSGGEAIGVFRSFEVTEKGLYFTAEILPTTLGKDLFIQLEAGALDTFSVGFRALESREVKASELRARGVHVPANLPDNMEFTEFTKAELMEVSTVLFPANPGAKLGAKSEDGKKSEGVRIPVALQARKNASAIGSGVTWVYANGEPGFGIVADVVTGKDVTSDDGDVFEPIEGDPVYRVEVYLSEDGKTYSPSGIYVYAYRSQMTPADVPSASDDGEKNDPVPPSDEKSFSFADLLSAWKVQECPQN